MEIKQLGGHYITACSCCDVLIHNKIGWDELHYQVRAHIELSPKCKTYYDSLPTFDDMRGIIGPDATDGLSSEDFIARQRNERDGPE